MAEQFANGAQTLLGADITASSTVVPVLGTQGFPSTGDFRIRVDNELMLVTGVSGTSWTVTRAIEPYAGIQLAVPHAANAGVRLVLTAASMQSVSGPPGPPGAPGTPGPPGPNTVSGSTTTPLAGILEGNGANVGTVTVGSGLSYSGTTLDLPAIGTAGTYGQVTTDAQGRVTAGATCDVAHGGTGEVTLTAHGVLLGQGTSGVTSVGVGATNQVLHGNTGADPTFSAVVEADLALTNVTTGNVSITAHGFAPILPNDATKFLDGTGAYSAPPGGSGALIGVRHITATGAGTYTPTAGTHSVIIELLGGGGGGSGATGLANANAVGLSGGGGGWCRKLLTVSFSGAAYSVGAKGTGGIAANGTGQTGGDTTFTTTGGSPVTYTAGGGKGGDVGGPTINFALPGGSGSNTGTGSGGVATNGDDNVQGGNSGMSVSWISGTCASGNGGTSMYSNGGASTVIALAPNTNAAGLNASGRGGGGGGAVASGAGTGKAGGDGSDGLIIIWEYS